MGKKLAFSEEVVAPQDVRSLIYTGRNVRPPRYPLSLEEKSNGSQGLPKPLPNFVDSSFGRLESGSLYPSWP